MFTAIYISEFNIVYRIKTIGGPIKEFQDLVDNEIYVYIFFIGRCFPLKIITFWAYAPGWSVSATLEALTELTFWVMCN